MARLLRAAARPATLKRRSRTGPAIIAARHPAEVNGEPADSGNRTSKGPVLRQLLRRLAVPALLASVAATGAASMIANPAGAVAAKSDLSQAASWRPGPSRPAPTRPTTPTPAPTTPSPANPTEQALQTEVNRLVNVHRGSNGCATLTVNDQLTAAARGHSAWMAQTGTFSHTGSGGSTFVTRAKAAGYAQPSAENIAMGYRTAAEVVNGWMNSTGHRANILNCQSKAVGVGVVYTSGGTPYYTQNFGY